MGGGHWGPHFPLAWHGLIVIMDSLMIHNLHFKVRFSSAMFVITFAFICNRNHIKQTETLLKFTCSCAYIKCLCGFRICGWINDTSIDSYNMRWICDLECGLTKYRNFQHPHVPRLSLAAFIGLT